jgi:hypothetical protein
MARHKICDTAHLALVGQGARQLNSRQRAMLEKAAGKEATPCVIVIDDARARPPQQRSAVPTTTDAGIRPELVPA